MKEAIRTLERRVNNQKEECDRVKERLLKSLNNEFSSTELSKASILYQREESYLIELEAKLELALALEREGIK